MMIKSISFIHKITAVVVMFAITAPAMMVRADANRSGKPLTEDQKILHVLNRLGFGARPGDVEKVKAMGLQKYIDQQLNPASINDANAEIKVKRLDIFDMSTAELFAKYPNPTALLQQLETQDRQANTQSKNAPATPPNPADPGEMTEAEQRERREKIQQIYAKYDLKAPAQIVPQIVANRVLRAVYSERQLQEVMVDFWQNHFNVFSGKAAVRWYIPSYERDVLRKNALGNFKDLVVGTAQHPAMLFYLDNFESVAPQPVNSNAGAQRLQQMMQSGAPLSPQARERLKQQYGVDDAGLDKRLKEIRANPPAAPRARRGINENYARELMELHTLGVDGGYAQNDIIEVAKCFTGWTIADPRGYRRSAAAMVNGTQERRIAQVQRQLGAMMLIAANFSLTPVRMKPARKPFSARKWTKAASKTG